MSKRSNRVIDDTLRRADNAYRADKIKEIRRLKRNIESRLKRISTNSQIQKQFGGGLNNQALRSYRRIKQPKNLKTAKDKTLDNYLTRLRQFNRTQFSTVKGYKKYKLWEETVINEFHDAGQIASKGLLTDLKDKIFELYGKFIVDRKFVDKYKYDLWRTSAMSILRGQTDEEIYQTLMNKYDELMTDEEKNEEIKRRLFEQQYPKRMNTSKRNRR